MSIFIECFLKFILFLNNFVGDWGITILLITFTVKFALLPISLKQKKSLAKQQLMTNEVNALKKKYQHDKAKLDEELTKISAKYMSSLSGLFASFLQLPVLLGLYKAILSIPVEVLSTGLLPWISDLKLPDSYYLIPVISVIVQLLPNSLYYIKAFKGLGLTKPTFKMIIPILLINILFVANAPAIVGVYWISSGIYLFVEQVLYNFYRLRNPQLN